MASVPRHLRVFLASPGDVVDEREIALKVLDDLPYDPLLRGKVTIEDVAWDKRGAGTPILAGITPQDSVAAGLPKPSECDIVVVIFWSRMGTPLPTSYQKEDGSRYESGTEWEYEEAVRAFRAQGSPYVLLYRRTQPVLLNPDQSDFDERRVQYDKVKRFFGALKSADGSANGGFTTYDVPGDFRDRLEHHLKSLIARILDTPPVRESASVALPEPWQGSPFPGLRAFTAADAPIFFGREREIDALIARIMEHRFVAVVGASGSGKSSLVAAGVIPRLQLTAGSAGKPEWLTLQFTPDRLGTGDPFASLAAAVLHALPQTQQKGLATKLRKDPALLASLLPPQTLVFIDQFEELFTTVHPSLRAPFVDVLQHVHAIITVRADFYVNCVETPALARLVQNSTFPLAVPGIAALYEMITRPAARAALNFEAGLPQRILDDTGQEPGALALMAYTLDELYRRRLTFAAYEELGGVQGAIGERSEGVFSSLGEEEKAALPRVFRELVDVDERGTATRQRAPLARVAATHAARRLTDALTEARLLVPSRGEDDKPVVEVAHEALFRSWSRLAAWIRGAADDLRLLRQVRTAAAEWDRSGRREHFLWPHERLEPVYAMRDRIDLALEPVVADFIRPEFERITTAMSVGLSDVRERALIERLRELGPSAARSLVECLPHVSTSEARSDIFEALRYVGRVAIPYVLEAIASVENRDHAIEALTHVDPAAGTHLLPDLLVDDNERVRAAAALLVAHARADHEIPALSVMLQKDVASVREAALIALATFDSQATVAGLVAGLESRSLRFTAIELIAELAGDERQRSFVDPDDRFQLLMGRNPVLRRLPALIQVTTAVARLSFEYRGQVHTALTRLLSPKLIEASVSAASSQSDIEELFRVLTGTHSPAILALLSSAEPRLQRQALRSILRLATGDFSGPNSIYLGLDVTSPDVREQLYRLLRHDDEQVRDAAEVALNAIERLELTQHIP